MSLNKLGSFLSPQSLREVTESISAQISKTRNYTRAGVLGLTIGSVGVPVSVGCSGPAFEIRKDDGGAGNNVVLDGGVYHPDAGGSAGSPEVSGGNSGFGGRPILGGSGGELNGGFAGTSGTGGIETGGTGGIAGIGGSGGTGGEVTGGSGGTGGEVTGGSGGTGGEVTGGSGGTGGSVLPECLIPYDPLSVETDPITIDFYTSDTDKKFTLCASAALGTDGLTPYQECFTNRTSASINWNGMKCPCSWSLISDGAFPAMPEIDINAKTNVSASIIPRFLVAGTIDHEGLRTVADWQGVSAGSYTSTYGIFASKHARCHFNIAPIPGDCGSTEPVSPTREEIFDTFESLGSPGNPNSVTVPLPEMVFFGFQAKPCK